MSLVVRFLPLVAGLVAWVQGRGLVWLIAGVAWAVFFTFLYWKARRDGYVRFMGDAGPPPADAALLPPNQKVAVRATGVFGVADREDYVLERPAEYWRVPLNEHIIMVQQSPGRFLYQMFHSGTLHEIQPGRLLHGARPRAALAIRITVTWGPDVARYEAAAENANRNGHAPEPKNQRWLYLTFDDEASRRQVWQTVRQELAAAGKS
jgi:hypothetical protein